MEIDLSSFVFWLLVIPQIHYLPTRTEIYLVAPETSHSELNVRDLCDVFFYYIFVLLCLFLTRMLRLTNVFLLKWTLLVSQNFEEHCLLDVTF